MNKKHEVHAWLMLAAHYHGILSDIERKVMELVGEHDTWGYVSDFVWCGETDAAKLIGKVNARKKLMKR